MRDLAIYGAGGFGRETALMLEHINAFKQQWNVIGFYDDQIPKDTEVDSLPVLGGMQDAQAGAKKISIAIAIADPALRKAIAISLKNSTDDYPTLVHPQAMTGRASNRFGRGSIITAGCVFTTGITLSDFCIINLSTTIGHDVHIGSFTTVMPGCNISGNVSIGPSCMIGTGVQILQNLQIGEGSRMGAGAVVTKNFGEFVTAVGVPAEKIK